MHCNSNMEIDIHAQIYIYIYIYIIWEYINQRNFFQPLEEQRLASQCPWGGVGTRWHQRLSEGGEWWSLQRPQVQGWCVAGRNPIPASNAGGLQWGEENPGSKCCVGNQWISVVCYVCFGSRWRWHDLPLSTACQCISRLCHWLVFFRVFLWYVLDDWTCTVCTGLSLWALDAECSSTKGSKGRPHRTVKQQLKWVDGHEEHEEEPQIWQTTLCTQLAVLDKLCHRLHSGFKAFGLASS